jgi:hypothetical protein
MVYFDAPPGSGDADFFVQTDFGIVEHVGTQYAASLDGDALVVSVREGEARIRDADRELAAAAGEQIRLEVTGSIQRSALSADHPDWAWVENLARASFDGSGSVMSLLEWAARESGKQVRADSDAVRVRAESVTVNQIDGLTPAELLSVIRSTTEFELTESDTFVNVTLR